MATDAPPAADPAAERRLSELPTGLLRLGASLRLVDYRAAEDDCVRLAERLRQAVGDDLLAAAAFRAIPRGGLVVLGLLSSVLNLPHKRLRDDDPAAPLVLVDDCALTGLRLRQELAAVDPQRRVVVAHLYSCPQLRQAVLDAEPRVEACVAAHDLADLAEELYPDPAERRRWRRRWQDRLGGDRYWIGFPELVAFAWNEPDRPFWNDATGAVEDGWRFVPPDRCLKNRLRLSGPRPPAPAPEEWVLPPGVVWGDFDGILWLYRSADDDLFSLTGTAAVAWKALLSEGGVAGAATALERGFEVAPETAAADVEALAADLLAAGLLERRGGPG